MRIIVGKREGEVALLDCHLIFCLRKHVFVMSDQVGYHLRVDEESYLPGLVLVPMIVKHYNWPSNWPDLRMVAQILSIEDGVERY